MNLYQFIASLIGSLAWPIAIAFIFVLFRKELRAILPRMRVKYGEVDISVRLEEAEKEAAKSPVTVLAEAPTPTQEEKEKFEKIAELSPRAAILELRNELQGTLTDFALNKGVIFKPPRNALGYMVRVLRNDAMIDAETSSILDDLRVVGNTAAHDDRADITHADAMRYKSLVEVVLGRLRAIESGEIVPTQSAEHFYPRRATS